MSLVRSEFEIEGSVAMSGIVLPGPVVTIQWLSSNLAHSRLLALEANLNPVYKGTPTDDGAQSIPSARAFNIEGISDPGRDMLAVFKCPV